MTQRKVAYIVISILLRTKRRRMTFSIYPQGSDPLLIHTQQKYAGSVHSIVTRIAHSDVHAACIQLYILFLS